MKNINKNALRSSFIVAVCSTMLASSLTTVKSEEGEGVTFVNGTEYTFYDTKSKYDFAKADETENIDDDYYGYGDFSLGGSIVDISEINGVQAFEVAAGSDISFNYVYSDDFLTAGKDEVHLIDDNEKSVNGIRLGKSIKKGAIIVQSSKDGKVWNTDYSEVNAFKKVPVRTDPFYSPEKVQLTNGHFYRVIIAYEMELRIGQNQFLFIKTDVNDSAKFAESYEFYLKYSNSASQEVTANTTPRYVVNEKRIKTKTDNGYSGSKSIDKDDPHYGWDIGDFIVNGYTHRVEDEDGSVFLKNAGDTVTLWFHLDEDINKLNGSDSLSIADDSNGYDKEFEVENVDFKHGALIIRYTNHENQSEDPIVYTDYLNAIAKKDADTKVHLFQEGDYEVVLDYEIKNDPRKVFGQSIVPTYTDYRIRFNFKVRNGNCMVFPFDIKTGNELSNSSVTENGFYLDMAKSRYLSINVKREVLKDSSDELDVRFNRPARDGEKYTDEGIYTFTVKNLYTGQETTKQIYVGTNKILKAYAKTGFTIPEIRKQLAQGATILEDGSITTPAKQNKVYTEDD